MSLQTNNLMEFQETLECITAPLIDSTSTNDF